MSFLWKIITNEPILLYRQGLHAICTCQVIETYTCVHWWHSFSLAFSVGTLVLSQSLYQSPIIHTRLPTTNTVSPVNYFSPYLLTIGTKVGLLSLSTVYIITRVRDLKIKAYLFTCLSEQEVKSMRWSKKCFFFWNYVCVLKFVCTNV